MLRQLPSYSWRGRQGGLPGQWVIGHFWGKIMELKKTLLVTFAAAMLTSAPVLAQETPPAGGTTNERWESMPDGSYVMIGGFIFIVVAGALVLDDDDSKPGALPGPTPSPAPAPTTTTTTTTTTT